MAQRKRQERIWNEKIEYNYVVVMQMERFNMEKMGRRDAPRARATNNVKKPSASNV